MGNHFIQYRKLQFSFSYYLFAKENIVCSSKKKKCHNFEYDFYTMVLKSIYFETQAIINTNKSI